MTTKIYKKAIEEPEVLLILEQQTRFRKAIQSLPKQTRKAVLKGFSLATAKHEEFYTPNGKLLPYGYHLVSVALNVINYGIQDPEPILLSLWHDLIEDKKITEKNLKAYIKENREAYGKIDPDRIVSLLNKLNRKNYPGNYSEATEKYYQTISENPETLMVKCADLTANVSEYLRNLEHIKTRKAHLLPKYFGEFVNFLSKNKNFKKLKSKNKIEQELTFLFEQIFNKLTLEDIENFQTIARKKYSYDFKKALQFFQKTLLQSAQPLILAKLPRR